MTKKITRSIVLVIIGCILVSISFMGNQHLMAASNTASVTSATKLKTAANSAAATSAYTQRFTTLYNEIKNPANGYFSAREFPIIQSRP